MNDLECDDPDEVNPRTSPMLSLNVPPFDPFDPAAPPSPWISDVQNFWIEAPLEFYIFPGYDLPGFVTAAPPMPWNSDIQEFFKDSLTPYISCAPKAIPATVEEDTDDRGSQTWDVKTKFNAVIEVLSRSFGNLWPSVNLSAEFDGDPKVKNLAAGNQRKRLGLPLIVFSNTKEESIVACPDSGSDDNIMSRELADRLGLPIMDAQDPASPIFVIANGRTVSALGQVRLKCAFKQGSPATAAIECVFYVFQTLAVPMIMGLDFLHATETLTKHRDRLVEELVPPMRALRVCSVGRPKRDVVCRVDNHVGCARADTGSDLDLVSPEYAAAREFHVEESCVELEFADGSTGYTLGIVRAAFSIGRVSHMDDFIPKSKEMSLELFILENLNADILVGTDTIQELGAFTSHEDCFIPAMPSPGESDLNIIRYIGAVERGLSRAWEFTKHSFTTSEKQEVAKKGQGRKRKRPQQDDRLLHDQLDNRRRLRVPGITFTNTTGAHRMQQID